MQNLQRAGQSKIIIPIVYQEDYMGALKRLTRQADPATYIWILQRAYTFSAVIAGANIEAIEKVLKASNAFKEWDKAKPVVPD